MTDEEAAQEQVVFDEHQKTTMEFIDRLGDLLAKPQPGVTTPVSTNDRAVDRHLDYLGESVQIINRAVRTPMDEVALNNYLDEIKGLEGELQRLKDKIFSLDDIGDRERWASDIKRDLLDLRVVVSRLN